MKKIISFALISAMLLGMFSFPAYAAVPINVVSINPTVEPSWSTDYWQVSINLDEQISSEALGNVQASSDATLKAALRNNIKIDNILLGDILTTKGDYSVMVEYNGSSINLVSSKGEGVFSATSEQKIEVLSGLLDGTKTKNFNPTTYYHWTNNVWATTEQPIKVVSIAPIVEPTWSADYWKVSINFNTQITSEALGNVQASSDATLKAALRNNIKIDGVLLGDILATKGDYEVMVEYVDSTINLVAGKGTNIFSTTSYRKIEVLSGLCNSTKTKTVSPTTYYHWTTNVWSTIVQPINVNSISPTIEPSWSTDYWQVSINFGEQISSQFVGNVQAGADAILKSSVRNNIKIDGVLLEDILAARDDYAVMVHYNSNTIDLCASKGANIFSATSSQKIEILSGLYNEAKTRNVSPITYYHTVSNVWSTTPTPIDVVSMTPIVVANWDENFYTMNINLTQPISTTNLGNVQASSDVALKDAVRNNIKIDDVLLGDICNQLGEYEFMVAYNAGNSITLVISKKYSVVSPVTDHKIEILSGLCNETKTINFNYSKYYYSAAKRQWGLTEYIPVTFANYRKSANNIITNVATNSKVSDINNPNNIVVAGGSTLVIKDKLGNVLTNENDSIGTGVTIEVKYGTTLYKTYTVVIYGDVEGNGDIDLDDLVAVRNDLLETTPLTGIFETAGNLYGEDKISLNDLVGIMAVVSESGTINQNH